MNAIRVLITDDHLIVREGLRLILETAEGIEVVGEARDGGECLRLVAELAPDVVLMDLQMPGMDGITAIGYLRREVPAVAIVILTTFNEDALMLQGLQAGARGYLLKDTDRATLLDTIQAAARGETLLRPEILSRVLAAQAKPPAPDPAPAVTPWEMSGLCLSRATMTAQLLPSKPLAPSSYPMLSTVWRTTPWMSTTALDVISPATTATPVVIIVSHATRLVGSWASMASRIASEIWSATLSGCPSLTLSLENTKFFKAMD